MNGRRTLWLLPAFVLLSFLVANAILRSVAHRYAMESLLDTGFVQLLTAAVLGLTFLFAFCSTMLTLPVSLSWVEGSILMLVYTLRELDFHRFFTKGLVTNFGFYFGPSPIVQKMIAGSVLLLLFLALSHLIWSHWRVVFDGIARRTPWALHLALWAGLLFCSQAIDKIDLVASWAFTVVALEETLELAAALTMAGVVVQLVFDPPAEGEWS